MFIRSIKNPIIKIADVIPSHKDFKVVGAFNPAAVVFKNEIIMLIRVAETCFQEKNIYRAPVYEFASGKGKASIKEFNLSDPDVVLKDTRGVVYKGKDYLSSISHIRIARSYDGENFTVDDSPFIAPTSQDEEYGVEDPRITFIDGKYYINYSIVSQDSWCTALSVTEDFKSYQKLGIIFHPENKDVAIFPEKVNGKYIALHRPNNSGFGNPSIWYSESPDLIHWGKHKCLLRSRDNDFEQKKIGGGAPPIKTDEGWLCIYHAKGADSKYTLMGLLLDIEKPWKIIRRSETPIFEPVEMYEKNGFFGNTVFTNGMVERDGKLYMYYGAADEVTCLATTTVKEVLNSF
jgi:beta-1,2-mannobiose phosphorylase / 1,2-beta-oligomannan phosphorylase